MPNPRFDRSRGTCHDCSAGGGAVPTLPWAVVCLRPQDSGKAISRMPEMGCCYWQAQERAEAHPATLPLPPG
jgi:hypothetical protein